MGSGDAELCSDATCGVESSTGGGANYDARSPGVCKVGLVVSWMMAPGVYKVGLVVSWIMAPGANVGVVGDTSNDSELLGH